MIYLFAKAINRVAPWWASTGNVGALLYGIGSALDELRDRTVRSARLALSGATDSEGALTDAEKLAYLGADRGLTRGIDETDVGYAARIGAALPALRGRGGPYAMLEQLYAYYAADPFPIDLVYRNGLRYRLAVDGTITEGETETSWWTDDGGAWARWRLYYHGTAAQAGTDLTRVPTDWNAAHCNGTVIVLGSTAHYWGYPDTSVEGEEETWTDTATSEYQVNW